MDGRLSTITVIINAKISCFDENASGNLTAFVFFTALGLK